MYTEYIQNSGCTQKAYKSEHDIEKENQLLSLNNFSTFDISMLEFEVLIS